jgi:hypothetical protein
MKPLSMAFVLASAAAFGAPALAADTAKSEPVKVVHGVKLSGV